MLTGARSFNCGIQSEQVGLVGYVVHNANFGRNLLHGLYGA